MTTSSRNPMFKVSLGRIRQSSWANMPIPFVRRLRMGLPDRMVSELGTPARKSSIDEAPAKAKAPLPPKAITPVCESSTLAPVKALRADVHAEFELVRAPRVREAVGELVVGIFVHPPIAKAQLRGNRRSQGDRRDSAARSA